MLSFERVSKRYQRKGPMVLDDVSWTVATGARACLLGPNGAGKSTSVRLLQGALRPTSGRVTLLGAEADSPAYLEARRRTGIVPQGPGMYPDLTVAELLRLALALYGRGNIDHVVEAFGLQEHFTTILAHLSGGFQRRLTLALALLAEPEVLLLDEPTVGLDPVAAHDVHAYLKSAMQGRTVLLCTHNLAEAEALCDQVIILNGGRVLVHESLETLRQRATPRVRLQARQGPAALASALQSRGFEPQTDAEDGVLILVPDPPSAVPELLRGLLADGLDIYACEPTRATLQTLFLDVVRKAA
jgi:ABC-2 type transport system ATP-binding protein